MEFDPSFQGPQYLSSLFPGKSYLKPQTQTMFPSQSSILTPPPPPPPIMLNPNNTFHYFQGHIMNVPTYNLTFVGLSYPITTPFYGMSTLSLGDESSLGGFVNTHHHHHVTLAPNNNALHDHQKGKIIWDFSQQTMVHPSEASSSKSPSPLSFSNEYGWVMSDYLRDIDKKINVEKYTNIANDNIRKGSWTPEEDRALLKLVNQFGLKKWSQIAKLLHGRIGKQCRERWHNHLRPNIRKDSWTLVEDIILMKAHQELGNKWSQIAKSLHGRTENTIKNRWNAAKRRRNCKWHKNKHASYEGSVLHAYVKRVFAIEQA